MPARHSAHCAAPVEVHTPTLRYTQELAPLAHRDHGRHTALGPRDGGHPAVRQHAGPHRPMARWQQQQRRCGRQPAAARPPPPPPSPALQAPARHGGGAMGRGLRWRRGAAGGGARRQTCVAGRGSHGVDGIMGGANASANGARRSGLVRWRPLPMRPGDSVVGRREHRERGAWGEQKFDREQSLPCEGGRGLQCHDLSV